METRSFVSFHRIFSFIEEISLTLGILESPLVFLWKIWELQGCFANFLRNSLVSTSKNGSSISHLRVESCWNFSKTVNNLDSSLMVTNGSACENYVTTRRRRRRIESTGGKLLRKKFYLAPLNAAEPRWSKASISAVFFLRFVSFRSLLISVCPGDGSVPFVPTESSLAAESLIPQRRENT